VALAVSSATVMATLIMAWQPLLLAALTSLGFDVEIFGGYRMVHTPYPPVAGFALAIVVCGVCGEMGGVTYQGCHAVVPQERRRTDTYLELRLGS
jgi:hypothetical protein